MLALKLIILYCASYIIPKKRGLFLFGSLVEGKFSDNSKYLFLYLKSGIWTSDDVSLRQFLNDRGFCARPKSLWLLLRAEYLFISDSPLEVGPSIYLLGRFKIVQMRHGSPIKKLSFDLPSFATGLLRSLLTRLTYSNFCMMLANDNQSAENLKSAFKNSNVQVLGLPRHDVLIEASLRGYSFFDYSMFAKYKQVILYSPTFRDNQEEFIFSEDFCNQLQDYCKGTNSLFIVKKHRADRRQILLKSKSWENICDLSTEIDDINELFCHIDLVITDYSSLIFDYVLTGKPFILYCFDLEEYINNNRQLYFNYEQEMPGPIARTETQLLALIQNRVDWFNHAEYKQKYRAFCDKFNIYPAGGACRRILSHLNINNSLSKDYI